jgi:N-formylglutamate amidohydrolase
VRRQITLTDGELDEELIKMTDHSTLRLFASGAPEGQVIRAPVSRLVVDVERFADDRNDGAGFSDTGISGFRSDRQQDRRDEVHEDAKT